MKPIFYSEDNDMANRYLSWEDNVKLVFAKSMLNSYRQGFLDWKLLLKNMRKEYGDKYKQYCTSTFETYFQYRTLFRYWRNEVIRLEGLISK